MKKSFIVLSGILLAAPMFAQSGMQSGTTQNPNTQSASQSTNQQSTNQNQNSNSTQNTQYQTQSQNQNEPQSAASQESQAHQKQGLSWLATRMINNTTEARDAIQQQNPQEALMFIGRASEDLSQIRKAQPNHKMIPIFTEVSTVWVIGPIHNRAGTPQANTSQGQTSYQGQQTASNQPNQAGQAQWEQSQGASNASNSGNVPALTVHNIRGRFTSVWLDTQGDTARLQAAHEAVENEDYAAANQALAAVQDSLLVETVKGDMPLLRARENLILARDAAKNGDQMEVRAALQAASNALAQYASNGGRHAQKAELLSSQVASASRTPVSTSQINGWWNQVSDWTGPTSPQG